MENIEGLGTKGKHREDDRRKIHTFRGKLQQQPEVQRKCDFCQQMHMLTIDGESPRRRIFASVVYLKLTKGRIASGQENVE